MKKENEQIYSRGLNRGEAGYLLAESVRAFHLNVRPSQHSNKLLSFVLSLNGFGINWLAAQCNDIEIRSKIVDGVHQAVTFGNKGKWVIQLLGLILRSEKHPTSWLNVEKQLFRHRILDCFANLLQSEVKVSIKNAILKELFISATTNSPTVTVDVRGQSLDVISEFIESFPSHVINVPLEIIKKSLVEFHQVRKHPFYKQITEIHDTIDPFVKFPAKKPILDILWQAASYKASERGFVFGLRLLDIALLKLPHLESSLLRMQKKAISKQKSWLNASISVLSAPEFERFIKERFPSRSSTLSDYAVDRHQVLAQGLSIHELCRGLIACPENGSSELRARIIITAFFRQVFAIGQGCNIGLDARPFFIDHGFGPTGEQLDWPSFIFIPAGVIWGKGAGVDLSCGVAFGEIGRAHV